MTLQDAQIAYQILLEHVRRDPDDENHVRQLEEAKRELEIRWLQRAVA